MNNEENSNNQCNQQFILSGASVSTLIQERKQWYLNNEYKEFKGKLPPFIQLKLDTNLRRDTSVLNWLYSR